MVVALAVIAFCHAAHATKFDCVGEVLAGKDSAGIGRNFGTRLSGQASPSVFIAFDDAGNLLGASLHWWCRVAIPKPTPVAVGGTTTTTAVQFDYIWRLNDTFVTVRSLKASAWGAAVLKGLNPNGMALQDYIQLGYAENVIAQIVAQGPAQLAAMQPKQCWELELNNYRAAFAEDAAFCRQELAKARANAPR